MGFFSSLQQLYNCYGKYGVVVVLGHKNVLGSYFITFCPNPEMLIFSHAIEW